LGFGRDQFVFRFLHFSCRNNLFLVQAALAIERTLRQIAAGLHRRQIAAGLRQLTAFESREDIASTDALAFDRAQQDDARLQGRADLGIRVLIDAQLAEEARRVATAMLLHLRRRDPQVPKHFVIDTKFRPTHASVGLGGVAFWTRRWAGRRLGSTRTQHECHCQMHDGTAEG